MDKRCEHFHFSKLSGLPKPATILTCVIQTQPALKSRSRRSAAMRCRSIGYSGFVHSVHQSDESFSGNRSGCLCKHETANLWAKLKSPKLSSWEDSSPSRSTANNQKCSESSSRSLSPCPLSYSNPCITSVYASHLLKALRVARIEHCFWDGGHPSSSFRKHKVLSSFLLFLEWEWGGKGSPKPSYNIPHNFQVLFHIWQTFIVAFLVIFFNLLSPEWTNWLRTCKWLPLSFSPPPPPPPLSLSLSLDPSLPPSLSLPCCPSNDPPPPPSDSTPLSHALSPTYVHSQVATYTLERRVVPKLDMLWPNGSSYVHSLSEVMAAIHTRAVECIHSDVHTSHASPDLFLDLINVFHWVLQDILQKQTVSERKLSEKCNFLARKRKTSKLFFFADLFSSERFREIAISFCTPCTEMQKCDPSLFLSLSLSSFLAIKTFFLRQQQRKEKDKRRFRGRDKRTKDGQTFRH